MRIRTFEWIRSLLSRFLNLQIIRASEYHRLLQRLDNVQELQRMHQIRLQLSGQMRSVTQLLALQSDKRSSQKNKQKRKRKIAVVMTSAAQITQLKALAGADQVRKGYDLIVVSYADPGNVSTLNFCNNNDIMLLSSELKILNGSGAGGNSDLGSTAFPDAPDFTAFSAELSAQRQGVQELAKLAAEVQRQNSIKNGALRFLRHAQISLVVMFEDNAEGPTGIWATVAQDLAIPTVILPYTIADHLEAAETHYGNSRLWADEDNYNRLARNILPHWLHQHRGRWLLRRQGVSAIAAEALGVAPPAPWVLNSSKADVIAVESEAMRQHYLKHGIFASQLAITGSVTDDLLYAAQKEKAGIRKKLGLDAKLPILLCSFPPNQLSEPRPGCEFSSFRGIVDFWLGELAQLKKWQVIVKPHPSMRLEDVDYLKSFDLRVTDMETTSLIPVCDLYNTSVSSTIRWALACGKPVLNYDVYNYRYQDFVAEPAVATVSSAADFAKTLRHLTGDGEMLEQMTEKANVAAPRWGMLDGQSIRRIAELFRTLLSDERNPPALGIS